WARRFGFGSDDELALDEAVAAPDDPLATLQLRRVNAVLELLSDELRAAFVLRFVEQLTLEEVAAASRWSLATTKRKLAQAKRRFAALARADKLLWDRLSPGAFDD